MLVYIFIVYNTLGIKLGRTNKRRLKTKYTFNHGKRVMKTHGHSHRNKRWKQSNKI